MENKNLTGYPSIDKPWLKYYSEEAINAPLPECTIYEYLWENNKNHLDDIALVYFGRKITYKELFENIDKAACSFSSIGVKINDIVTICAVSIPETIYSFYGLNKIGVISNMVDPRTSVEGIRHYIEEANSNVVMCLDAAFPKVMAAIKWTNINKIIIISPADSLPQSQKTLYKIFNSSKTDKSEFVLKWKDFIKCGKGTATMAVAYKFNACCVIVHTGGTTGTPKGVMLTNDNLNGSAFQTSFYNHDLKRGQSWLNIMPPFIAYGIVGFHIPLSFGIQVILIPQFNPKKFDDILIKYKPNHMIGVPSHYNNIINSRKMVNMDLSFIIAPTVGGDNLDVAYESEINNFLKQHGCKWEIIKGYGMTEVSAAVCVCSADCNKLGSVGIPFSRTIISSFDLDSGKELKYGQDGEICMTGSNTMLCYYNNPQATKNIIKIHDDGLPWVHSGDIGYVDQDGFVFIKGRIKRMIIRHDGFKVFPPLIESVVEKHNKVNACCAVGIADKNHLQGQLPVVFFETEGDCIAETKRELAIRCQEELPEYAQPVEFININKLPLTPIGKVDFIALERLAEEKENGKENH